jgi:hypothetical protein
MSLFIVLMLLAFSGAAMAQSEPTAQPALKAQAPLKAQAVTSDNIKVELKQILSDVSYNTGAKANTNFTVLTMNFPSRNKLWYGFYKMNWNAPASAPSPPYKEEYHTVGGMFYDRDLATYQVDYFRMTNSDNQMTETLGGEYCHRVGRGLYGGLGYYSSTFYDYKMTEYTLRLLYYATPRLSFNTKVYFTETTEDRRGTAIQEKIDFSFSPTLSIQLRGATGKRVHALDNDLNTFYSQYEDLENSLGAQVCWTFDDQASLFLGYSQDTFSAYGPHTEKVIFGGLNIRL